MRQREGGGEAMVRGEEAVATADEKMGEAEGGRGRRRARRRSASGGRGRSRTTAQTTPSRGGEPSLDLTGGRDDPPGGATGGGEDDRQGEGKWATIGGGEVESVRPRRSR